MIPCLTDRQFQIQHNPLKKRLQIDTPNLNNGRQHRVTWLNRGRTEPVFWALVHGRAAVRRPDSAGAPCVNKYFVLLWRAGLARRDEL